MVLSRDTYTSEAMNPFFPSISRVATAETRNVSSCTAIVLGTREYARNTAIVKDAGIRSTRSREEMP